MTRDEIIRMASECGLMMRDEPMHGVERFAALVAQAEREAIIARIEAYKVPVGNSAAGEMAAEWTMDALRDLRDAIRARSKA